MMADMLGNQISAGIASVPDFIENHRAGKVRIVATIGARRQALLPQVPTFGELGFANLDDLPYYGVFAPVGTPQPFVEFDPTLAYPRRSSPGAVRPRDRSRRLPHRRLACSLL